jgi:hypothetical protein
MNGVLCEARKSREEKEERRKGKRRIVRGARREQV